MAAISSSRRLLLLVFLELFAISHQSRRDDGFQDTLGHLRTKTSPQVQERAATDLIKRILGADVATLFEVHVDPNFGDAGKDTFVISKVSSSSQMYITGTSGIAVAWGFHYYLKNYCNVLISWDGNQISLPPILPDVSIKITSNDRFRYYQNVCTVGYTSVWWQWDKWERNIDWMALNGINLALAFNGQEAIWERVYLKLNLTRAEIDEHTSGPAFLPWARMGNIRGFGGPLTANWHAMSLQLQHRILQRMRELGMIPVLPAFAGHVPRAFSRIYPNTSMRMISPWNNFEDKYCCPYLLEPTDPLFRSIGEMFLTEYIEEFGTDHVYNCDTFNENEPASSELSYLAEVTRSVFSAMQTVDKDAIWLMQGWLFVHDFIFWTEPRAKAFLTALPRGKMIVLDLQSEQFPQYRRLKSYYGQPFIWCMLHNFGGTLGMFGSAQIINKRPFEARNMANSTMVGTGLTPEGINQNFVIYELMNEMAYRKQPVDLDAWFQYYATRRYGVANEYTMSAWTTLGRTIYNFVGTKRIRGRYVITRRPSLNISTWNWYDRDSFFNAWYTFIQARYGRHNSTLYRHDVVDITRQALQLTADETYVNIMDAYHNGDLTNFRYQARLLLDTFDDLEMILSAGENFLLGKWLEEARAAATNDEERKWYNYNARNQITLWGPNGEIRDYANKQWSGVVADYFKPRWAIFLDALDDCIVLGTKLNVTEINERMFHEVEKPFTLSTKEYPVVPITESIETAVKLIPKLYQSRVSRVQKTRLRVQSEE